MKKRFTILLLFTVFFAVILKSQDAPQAGQQFRIGSFGGLYLTCDPDWSSEGWNLFFLDSLYTVEYEEEVTFQYENTEREPAVLNLVTSPEKQTFTLINPDPNDPEIWAIEASNGQYLAADLRNGWDITLSESPDVQSSQVYFLDQGFGIYLIQILSMNDKYVAADHNREGIRINKWDDGWEYLARSFLYRDKPASQSEDLALWFLESTTESSVLNPTVQALNVYPTITDEILYVQAEKGDAVEILTLTGNKIMSTILYTKSIDVSDLSPGIYLIKSSTGSLAKFIKR